MIRVYGKVVWSNFVGGVVYWKDCCENFDDDIEIEFFVVIGVFGNVI